MSSFLDLEQRIEKGWQRCSIPLSVLRFWGIDEREFEPLILGKSISDLLKDFPIATEDLFHFATADAAVYYLGAYMIRTVRMLSECPGMCPVDLHTRFLLGFLAGSTRDLSEFSFCCGSVNLRPVIADFVTLALSSRVLNLDDEMTTQLEYVWLK